MVKRVGPASLRLVQNGAADVDIQVKLGPRNVWHGVASFPLEMTEDAAVRIDMVETPNDVEDLVREFSDEGTWSSYQDFRNRNDF